MRHTVLLVAVVVVGEKTRQLAQGTDVHIRLVGSLKASPLLLRIRGKPGDALLLSLPVQSIVRGFKINTVQHGEQEADCVEEGGDLQLLLLGGVAMAGHDGAVVVVAYIWVGQNFVPEQQEE